MASLFVCNIVLLLHKSGQGKSLPIASFNESCLLIDLDFYSCIKLVNYIRKERPDPDKLLEDSTVCLWSDDCYLIPIITDDPLLQLDFELNEESCAVQAKDEISLEGRSLEGR